MPILLAKKKVKRSLFVHIDPQCLRSCLGKHFLHFRLDRCEPQTAFVLSHGNYRLLPWQNNNSRNKERGTDELTALMDFYCPLPSISCTSSTPPPPPILICLALIVCGLICRTTPRLYCVRPKTQSIQSEAPSAESFSVFSGSYTCTCSTPRR